MFYRYCAVMATILLLASAWPATAVSAQLEPEPLPEALRADAPAFELLGETRFRKYFFHVYDAFLWVPEDQHWALDGEYALDITYARDFEGEMLARSGREQMAEIGVGDEALRMEWYERMKGLFPDVSQGDRLIGWHRPGQGAWFYYNDALLDTVEDAAFGEAFFAVWLDQRTSEPRMRRELLGEQD